MMANNDEHIPGHKYKNKQKQPPPQKNKQTNETKARWPGNKKKTISTLVIRDTKNTNLCFVVCAVFLKQCINPLTGSHLKQEKKNFFLNTAPLLVLVEGKKKRETQYTKKKKAIYPQSVITWMQARSHGRKSLAFACKIIIKFPRDLIESWRMRAPLDSGSQGSGTRLEH